MERRIDIRLLKEIQQTQFCALELALYLNTHSTDQRALNKRNELVRNLIELENRYTDNYAPLTLQCARFEYPWSWIEEPWPWQINY